MCTEQVPRWQHWGLHLKGLWTPSSRYIAEACEPGSRGSARQERGCDKGQRQLLLGTRPLGWHVSTWINTNPGLPEDSLSQHGQGGSKQAGERFGLSCSTSGSLPHASPPLEDGVTRDRKTRRVRSCMCWLCGLGCQVGACGCRHRQGYAGVFVLRDGFV